MIMYTYVYAFANVPGFADPHRWVLDRPRVPSRCYSIYLENIAAKTYQ